MPGGRVTFQAQNPAISGDRRTYRNRHGALVFAGWSNCTAFVAAMGAEFDRGLRISGTRIRAESSEPSPDPNSPGLSLRQVEAVLKRHGIDIDVRTPIDFDVLDQLRAAGHAIGLQLSYEPIQHSKFTGDPTFGGGHIVLWLPNGDVLDPLDDRRRPGIAGAPVRMPRSMLREAAGKLVLNAAGASVGIGRAYAAIFPTRHPPQGPSFAAGAMKPGKPAQPAKPGAPHFTFGAIPGRAVFTVVVPAAFVRTSPAGVPGRGNVIAKKHHGDLVTVLGTTNRGQRVAGSRVWHQIDREGRRFIHCSVIAPVKPPKRGPAEAGAVATLEPDPLPPLVVDPDVDGADEDPVEGRGREVDPGLPPPKNDVPDSEPAPEDA